MNHLLIYNGNIGIVIIYMLIYSLLAGVIFMGYVYFSPCVRGAVAFRSGCRRSIRSDRSSFCTESLPAGAFSSFKEVRSFCRKSVTRKIPYRPPETAG